MRGTKLFFKVQVLSLVIAVLLSNIGFVGAMESHGIGVLPTTTKDYPSARSWFVYEAEPGTIIKDRAKISNNTNETKTLTVAALDGAVTGSGGYTLIGSKENNKDIGTWVTLEKEEVTLAPKTSVILGFTVTVPEGADVGSHPGGIVIWEQPSESSRKGKQITIVTRVAARMYLTVPGDIVRKLEVENVRHSINRGVLYFWMTFHNKGNIQLTPETDITLRGIFGKIGTQEKSQYGLVLRGGTITSRVPWQNKIPSFGRFVADFRIHYGEKDFKGAYVLDEYIDVRYVFWIIPWIKILMWLGIVVLLYFLRNLWLWLTIQQRLNTKTKRHTVKKGENLSIIANLYNINAKKVARFNLLKWPYDLHEDDILLIPLGMMTKTERLASKSTKTDPRISIKLEPVVVEPGDSVKDVAEFANTTVKEIIELNHLRWPYRLKEGQELLIPVQVSSEIKKNQKVVKPKILSKKRIKRQRRKKK